MLRLQLNLDNTYDDLLSTVVGSVILSTLLVSFGQLMTVYYFYVIIMLLVFVMVIVTVYGYSIKDAEPEPTVIEEEYDENPCTFIASTTNAIRYRLGSIKPTSLSNRYQEQPLRRSQSWNHRTTDKVLKLFPDLARNSLQPILPSQHSSQEDNAIHSAEIGDTSTKLLSQKRIHGEGLDDKELTAIESLFVPERPPQKYDDPRENIIQDKSLTASIRDRLKHDKKHKVTEGLDIMQKPLCMFTPIPEKKDEMNTLKQKCTKRRMEFSKCLEDELNSLKSLQKRFTPVSSIDGNDLLEPKDAF